MDNYKLISFTPLKYKLDNDMFINNYLNNNPDAKFVEINKQSIIFYVLDHDIYHNNIGEIYENFMITKLVKNSNITKDDINLLIHNIYRQFITESESIKLFDINKDLINTFNMNLEILQEILLNVYDKNEIDIINIPPIKSSHILTLMKKIGFFDKYFNDFEMNKFINAAIVLLNNINNNTTIISVGNSPFLIAYIVRLLNKDINIINIPISKAMGYCMNTDLTKMIETLHEDNQNNIIQQYIKFLLERYQFIFEKLESGNQVILIDYTITGSSISFLQMLFYLAIYYRNFKKYNMIFNKQYNKLYKNLKILCFYESTKLEGNANIYKQDNCKIYADILSKFGIDYSKVIENNDLLHVNKLPNTEYYKLYNNKLYYTGDYDSYVNNIILDYLNKNGGLNINNANRHLLDQIDKTYASLDKKMIKLDIYRNQELKKFNSTNIKNYDKHQIEILKEQVNYQMKFPNNFIDYILPGYIIEDVDTGRCIISYQAKNWHDHTIRVEPISLTCFMIKLYINTYLHTTYQLIK